MSVEALLPTRPPAPGFAFMAWREDFWVQQLGQHGYIL